MANDMELQLSFSYDKKDLNNMLAQMENAIESADLDPNITGNTKKQLQEFQKEIKKFVKQTRNDFDKINGISLDSKAFDQYVKITDKRLDTLEGTVTQVIETLKGVDSSTDLSSIGKAFDNLKEKVLANNAAIKEMVDTASDLGAKVKIDVINETEIDSFIENTKRIKSELKTVQDAIDNFGQGKNQDIFDINEIVNLEDFEKLKKAFGELYSEYSKINKALNENPDKQSIDYLRTYNQRNELMTQLFIMANKLSIASEELDLDFGKQENSIEHVLDSYNKWDTLLGKFIPRLKDLRTAQKEGFSIASSSEMDGAKGNIPITASLKITTTSEQMFETIKKRLADVQEKINNQTLVVPVKYTLGTPRENAENPLAPTSKEIKDAQKGLDFNWDKTYAKIEKQAIDEAEKAAKNAISSVQAEMDKNPVAIKFDIPASEKKRVSELLAKNFLSTQINIGAVLQEAVSSAKELRDLMQEVYDTSIRDDTGSYLQRIRETTKQLTQAEKKEEKSSKKTKSQITNEVKEQANELHSQIQDSFNKNKIKIKLELEKAQLDSIRDKIADANLDKSLDIAGSLKEAVIASHNIAENLNSIKETNIKITGGKGSNKDLEDVKSQTQTLLMATSQLDEKLGKVQNSIKNIGKKDSGISDLTGDFDRIISKLDEMISTSKALVEDIRLDVSVIDTSFKELGNTLDKILDKKTFGDTISQSLEEFKVGINSLIKMLLEVINAIDKVKYSVKDIDSRTLESQWQSLNEVDNDSLNITLTLIKELDTTLSSVIESLEKINGLDKISSIFSKLDIKDDKLERINKIPDALKKIAEDVQELNNLPTSEFVEQIGKIAEQGEGLKALADILKNSEKKIQASMDVMTGNDKNKKILKEEIKLLEKYRTVYKNRSKDENEYSEAYSNNLREMEVLLTHIDKFKNLDFISEESIAEAKQLNSNLENIADNLEKITKTEVKATDSLIDSLKTQFKVSDSYERSYSSHWGYGKIEEGYVSEYSTKLSEIRQKLNEINSIRERFKNKTYLQEDLVNIKTYNNDLEEMFKELAKIEQVSKNTTTTNLQNKIGQYIQKNTRLTSSMYKELIGYYEELGQGSKLTKQRVNEIATAFNNVSLSAKTAGLEGAGFLDAIKNKLKYGWAQSIAMFFSFYDIIRYIREISGTVTELNSSLIELAKVSDASIGELYRDFGDFKDIAEQTGGTINDIINSTADWARNGYNLPESKELARLSSVFQNIGDGLTEAQANEYLVSTLKGFNLEANQTIDIMDKINNVSNNAASSVSNIGEALERSSSAFGAANTDLSQAISLLTTAKQHWLYVQKCAYRTYLIADNG